VGYQETHRFRPMGLGYPSSKNPRMWVWLLGGAGTRKWVPKPAGLYPCSALVLNKHWMSLRQGTGHLEHLGFSCDDFAVGLYQNMEEKSWQDELVQACEKPIRAHDDGAFGKLVVVLIDALEIVMCRVCLANGAGHEVHNLVPIPTDICAELCHAKMHPVIPNHGEDVAQCVRSMGSHQAAKS